MGKLGAWLLWMALALYALPAHPLSSASDPLTQAEALLVTGKAEEAWQLLRPLERQHAGDPQFDYLYGIAALESGRPNLATFILDRVIAAQPGHAAARLERARAYFALGDFERAEAEFAIIQRSDPPPATAAVVNRYLERLRKPAAASDWSGYVEVSVGEDTNVPAASALGSVYLPSLGAEFLADPQFQRQADNFVALGAGLEFSRPINRRLSFLAGAHVKQRTHADLARFDSRNVDLRASLQQALGARDALSYSVQYDEHDLDEARYRRTQAATIEWRHGVSARARGSVWAQAARVRYLQTAVEANSSNLLLAGVTASYLLEDKTRTIARLGVLAGTDDAVSGRADGDRRLVGVNGALQRRLTDTVEAFATASVVQSEYLRINPSFNVARRDRQFDASLGFSWSFAAQWFVVPQVSRTRQSSNLPLNEYSRTQTTLTLRRAWD